MSQNLARRMRIKLKMNTCQTSRVRLGQSLNLGYQVVEEITKACQSNKKV